MFFSDNIQRIQEWVDFWLSENGKVWSEAIGKRNRIIKQFISSISRYNMKDAINLRGSIDKAKWSIIGFASNKEYSAEILLNWYNTLVGFNSDYVSKYGKDVKNISDLIEMVGDNSFEDILNCKIFSDWGSQGPLSIHTVLTDNKYLSQCIENPKYLVEMLIGYLKHAEITETSLLTIWGFGMGLLDWRDEYTHSTIYALQCAIEKRASDICLSNIRNNLLTIGPAYMDLASDPVKYIIPDRWCDSTSIIGESDDAVDIIDSYLATSSRKMSSSDILRAIQSMHVKGTLEDSLVDKIIHKELHTEDSSIYRNSILEYVIKLGKTQSTNKAISGYLSRQKNSKYFYPELDLPALITWRMSCEGEEYSRNSVDDLLATFRCWLTSDNHIKAPDYPKSHNYCQYLKPTSTDIFELYVRILLIIVDSEDADAARVALGGLFSVIRNYISCISIIETEWNNMHYRAKEWLLMLYELCFSLCPSLRPQLETILSVHSHDNDFNVALYSKILHETLWPDCDTKYEVEEKDFFKQVPNYGTRRLIKAKTDTLHISGNDYVLEQIELLQKQISKSLDDLEFRTTEYGQQIDAIPSLIPLNRKKYGGYRVPLDKKSYSFFRVLYKDWYVGRWTGYEMALARCILSASEPYYLLLSPVRWKWNNGKLFDDVKALLQKSDEEKRQQIEILLGVGLKSDEVIRVC